MTRAEPDLSHWLQTMFLLDCGTAAAYRVHSQQMNEPNP
jgi:hypothetical protein